jgi:RHS repeat-associated protein
VPGVLSLAEVEVMGTAADPAQSFVTGQTLGAQRADSPGWTGMKITTSSQPVMVTSLGRLCSAGNSLTHELRLIRVSDNATVASANVTMAGCVPGQFKYAPLSSQATLAANTDYLVVSYEAGGDLFHDWIGTGLTTTSVAVVKHGVYSTNGGQTWGAAGGAGNSYVPVDFQYTTGGSSSGIIQWLVSDHLGTPRMIADKTGSLSGISRHDYLPFGEELYVGTGGRTAQQGYTADSVRQKFTQYERDDEPGLDYAQARYYSSMTGRFTTVDPILTSARKNAPQTWNRYAYVLNNPLRFVDPDGLQDQERNRPIETPQTLTIATEIPLSPLTPLLPTPKRQR